MKYARIYSPKRMVADLREERVGKKELYIYSAIFVLGTGLSLFLALGAPSEAIVYRSELLAAIDRFLFVVTSLVSLPLAYYINERGDGKHFWYRYVSLSIPIAIAIGVIGFIAFAFAAIVGFIDIEYYGYPDLALYLVLYGVATYVFCVGIRRVAAKTALPKKWFLERLLF